MRAERLQQVSPIFRRAVELPPAGRAAFLDSACAGDAALRRDVERLIDAHERAGSFIESPAYERAAGLLAAEPANPIVGQLTKHYRVVAPLGRGGMGEVYLAEDTRLHRKVALKVLHKTIIEDKEHLRRFEREAYAASALNHPNILTIYEIGETDSAHFIATEYIEGETLRELLKARPIAIRFILEMAIQAASALDD